MEEIFPLNLVPTVVGYTRHYNAPYCGKGSPNIHAPYCGKGSPTIKYPNYGKGSPLSTFFILS